MYISSAYKICIVVAYTGAIIMSFFLDVEIRIMILYFKTHNTFVLKYY